MYIYTFVKYIYINIYYIFIIYIIYIYIIYIYRETDRQTDRQTGRQTDRDIKRLTFGDATVNFGFRLGIVLISPFLFLLIILTRSMILQYCCRTRNDQAFFDAKFQCCHTIKQQSLADNN